MHVAGIGIMVVILAVVGISMFGAWMPGMPNMGPHMGGRPNASVPAAAPPAPGAATITVESADFSFRPVEVRIAAGRSVNVTLANRGMILHDLTIPALRFQLVAQPGQRAAGSVAAQARGTYELYCSVPGHREAGMVGRLVVN